MEKNNNVIRLTEQEFNALIQEAVTQVLNEGKFGDIAKNVGKGLGKTALYGALGAGLLYGANKGLENQERYAQELNKQGLEMQGPSNDEVSQWITDHGMEDTPQNREVAWEYINKQMQNESKQSDRLAQIIREEISKVL
jgi:hypothetical protein